jgi:hypothetical protein
MFHCLRQDVKSYIFSTSRIYVPHNKQRLISEHSAKPLFRNGDAMFPVRYELILLCYLEER